MEAGAAGGIEAALDTGEFLIVEVGCDSGPQPGFGFTEAAEVEFRRGQGVEDAALGGVRTEDHFPGGVDAGFQRIPARYGLAVEERAFCGVMRVSFVLHLACSNEKGRNRQDPTYSH